MLFSSSAVAIGVSRVEVSMREYSVLMSVMYSANRSEFVIDRDGVLSGYVEALAGRLALVTIALVAVLEDAVELGL